MYYYASNGIKTAVIIPDPDPTNPREEHTIGKMVCWHNRHRLGDDHDFGSPQDFAIDMVLRQMSEKDVLAAIKNGELPDFRMSPGEKEGEYVVEGHIGLIPGKEKWERMDWKVSENMEIIEGEDATFDLQEDILDWCSARDLLSMCEKHGNLAILPLFLYDHSGITMSTGSFHGRAPHAAWDSGQVGFIYMDKKTAMEQLSLAADTIHLAQPARYVETVRLTRFARNPDQTIEDILARNGYSLVRAEDIRNIDAPKPDSPDHPIIEPHWAADGMLYKKDHMLYVFEGAGPDNALLLQPVATFNPDLKPLTEDTWKARAEEVLEHEVKAYDNYLTGEVYGYETYEGTVLIDSCWGYNPGSQDIKDLMASELAYWFEGPMHFESDFGDDFHIEDFFVNHEFPEVREKMQKDVEAFITFEAETSQVYPFATPAAELLAKGNATMKNIVDALYEEHEDYDSDHIFEVIAHYAGYSRELQPKMTITDLEPGRDYTADEIMEVFNKKPSLKDMIAQAAAKKSAQNDKGKGFDPER